MSQRIGCGDGQEQYADSGTSVLGGREMVFREPLRFAQIGLFPKNQTFKPKIRLFPATEEE
jgi:hypothetical protein